MAMLAIAKSHTNQRASTLTMPSVNTLTSRGTTSSPAPSLGGW